MRMDKLTNQLQAALGDAQSLALGKDHNFIEPAHLLAVLLEQQGGSARPLLLKAGADVAGLRAGAQAAVEALPTVTGGGGDIQIANDLIRILNVADTLASRAGTPIFPASWCCWPCWKARQRSVNCSRPMASSRPP